MPMVNGRFCIASVMLNERSDCVECLQMSQIVARSVILRKTKGRQLIFGGDIALYLTLGVSWPDPHRPPAVVFSLRCKLSWTHLSPSNVGTKDLVEGPSSCPRCPSPVAGLPPLFCLFSCVVHPKANTESWAIDEAVFHSSAAIFRVADGSFWTLFPNFLAIFRVGEAGFVFTICALTMALTCHTAPLRPRTLYFNEV